MPYIIFPSYPNHPSTVAPFYEKDYVAAKEIGFEVSIASDANTSGPISISTPIDDLAFYRGWIVSPQYYHELSHLVPSLITDHDSYLWANDFPNWYASLKDHTPRSFYYFAEEVRNLGVSKIAQEVSQRTTSKSLLLKDWLKSLKHEWEDGCFISDASNPKEVERVISNFFIFRGREFRGGLVFREFLPLKIVGQHPKVKMPLPIEFRSFFLFNEPFLTFPYWSSDVAYPDNIEFPPAEWLKEIGERLVSPFVALDIAQDTNGKWWVIEVNDGGSAGLPEHVSTKDFYAALKKRVDEVL